MAKPEKHNIGLNRCVSLQYHEARSANAACMALQCSKAAYLVILIGEQPNMLTV